MSFFFPLFHISTASLNSYENLFSWGSIISSKSIILKQLSEETRAPINLSLLFPRPVLKNWIGKTAVEPRAINCYNKLQAIESGSQTLFFIFILWDILGVKSVAFWHFRFVCESSSEVVPPAVSDTSDTMWEPPGLCDGKGIMRIKYQRLTFANDKVFPSGGVVHSRRLAAGDVRQGKVSVWIDCCPCVWIVSAGETSANETLCSLGVGCCCDR